MPLQPPVSDAARLTEAFRSAQAKRAAQVAALVAAYYRSRVDPSSEASVKVWLDLMVARILSEHNNSAQQGALFASTLRRLEVPGAAPRIFTPKTLLNADQIERSLRVVGPVSFTSKATEISRLPDSSADSAAKAVMLDDARQESTAKIAGAVLRQVQNGGRQTTYAAATTDKVALGYVRVTRDKPCYFCALLASRGLQPGFAYTEDSFDLSDARFTGEGTAKVHDNCQCHLKPIYSEDDDYLDRSAFFEDLYREFSTGSGGDALSSFRKGYDAWVAGKVTVDF